MIYEFQKENGEVVQADFKMGECPKSIICDDGEVAIRIFSAPLLIIRSAKKSDYSVKTRQETLDIANEIGMRDFVPMKHQTPEQQLKDLKKNRSMFKDQMAESNEKTISNQNKRMLEMSRRNMQKASVEMHIKKQEAKAKSEFESRAISL